MKKWFAFLLAVLLLVSLTACGSPSKDNNAPAGDPQNTTGGEGTSGAGEDKTPEEDWGIEGDIAVRFNQDTQLICFRWPGSPGNTAGSGKAGGQGDDTFVLVDRYVEDVSPENVSLENFFPAYFEQTIAAFSDFYYLKYSDGSLTVESSEVSTVNGYEVCMFTGKHTYKHSGADRERAYVAYVTTLKSNGGYVYWLVQDNSSDQSNGALIRDHADRIIRSIWEPK